MKIEMLMRSMVRVPTQTKLFKTVLASTMAIASAMLLPLSAHAEFTSRNTSSDFDTAVSNVTSGNHFIKIVATGPNNSYVILYDVNGFYASANVPPALVSTLTSYKNQGYAITNVALTPTGGWCFFFGSVDPKADPTYGTNENSPVFGYYASNIPQSAYNDIVYFSNNHYHLKNISFGANGSFVLFAGYNGAYVGGVSTTIYNAVVNAQNAGYKLTDFSFAPNGGWVFLYNNSSYQASGIPSDLSASLQGYSSSLTTLDTVAFPPSASTTQASILFYLGRYNP